MSFEKKDLSQFPPEFVDALFRLPLAARQVIARKFRLPLTEEQLVLPTDADCPVDVDGLSPDELEAEALRGLMGYGRFCRKKEGSHDC